MADVEESRNEGDTYNFGTRTTATSNDDGDDNTHIMANRNGNQSQHTTSYSSMTDTGVPAASNEPNGNVTNGKKRRRRRILPCIGQSKHGDYVISETKKNSSAEVNIESERPKFPKRLIYGLTDTPPFYFLVFFALQQAFLAISTPLGTTVVVAEAVCASEEDSLKIEILSSTMLMMGLSTFFMTTLGVRLPIFQGPAPTYIIPLLAMSNLPEYRCPDTFRAFGDGDNTTSQIMAITGNGTAVPNSEIAISRINAYAGSMIAAGAIHTAIGVTGLGGILGRVVGPVTIVPTMALFGIFIHPVVVSFVETNWAVAIITSATTIVFSLYLAHKSTPVPMWSKDKGWHVGWYPLHQIFALLIGICVGWLVSLIMTMAGALSDDPHSVEYNARTDARSNIISETSWFTLPYPGQFGPISFSFGAFVTFTISAVLSVIDSIADYNATAKAAYAHPPPLYALNRGITVEGVMTILSGSLGCGHATVSFGENIGAISMSKVASRSVFQLVGIFYIILAIIGKLGAFFITLPYSVIGGTQIITFALLLGVTFSYLHLIDLNSTRNLSIIGMSILLGLSIPFWMQKNSDKIQTGSYDADNAIRMLLANPSFVGAFLACFLDNTIPGTDIERGIIQRQKKEEGEGMEGLELQDFPTAKESPTDYAHYYDDGVEVYRLPYVPDSFRRSVLARYIPLFDTHTDK